MFIVDTSGSMEYKAGSTSYPACYPTGAGTSERSRWVDLVEVLTGRITNYRCQSVDRKSTAFQTEYALPDGSKPPDANYRNPYHRPMSGTCQIGPTVGAPSPTNAFSWLSPSYHPYLAAGTCNFLQSPDGLIDSLGDVLRFGLMTFDTLPDPATGYMSGSYGPQYSSGAEGAWSYFVSSAASGHPVDCMTAQTLEVGVRNGSAPPWEGRLIPFGNPNASATDNANRHNQIEQVLLSSRPYGATPIAGALDDARAYFWEDDSADPITPILKYAPNGAPGSPSGGDPYAKGGCRDQYIILLTDGEPNLDMRKDCEGVTSNPSGRDGLCPFDKPERIAYEMATETVKPKVQTYVVGFAADTYGGSQDCSALTPADFDTPGGKCDTMPNDKALQTCCTLHRIAYNGGTEKAYFADDVSTLRTSLSEIFSKVSTVTSSATQPVRSPGVGTRDNSGSIAYRLLTSYATTTSGLWQGAIERMRWTCETGVPKEQERDPDKGDDFSANAARTLDQRKFYTFEPALSGTLYHAERSLRPNLPASTDDGAGDLSGQQIVGQGSSFVTAVQPGAYRPDVSVGSTCAGLTETGCRDRVMNWMLGFNNGTTELRTSVIGDVMHSTPVIVDRPNAPLSDETYEAFAQTNNGRPMMAYTSSNDGMLHGFLLSPNIDADRPTTPDQNNEVFAFFPPAVLPLLQSQYPKSRQKLLDGIPVVADVVASDGGANPTYYPFALERNATGAESADASSTWRTILVQGFGGAHAGYYAIDITSPKVDGPKFLWQLTTDEAGNPLFGQSSGTPIITTVFIGGKEVAVAVLPGGYGGAPVGVSCTRAGTWDNIPSDYTPRSQVHCYEFDKTNNGVTGDDTTTYIGARSLTIVRLDSGQIIKTFRRSVQDMPLAPAVNGPVIPTLLDSPITGVPAAYPAGPGAVADRIFVGDQDGGLWRVDVSKPDPANWEMDLFFDSFSKHPDVIAPITAAIAGRPIATAPVLSIDQRGQITVAFSTGDQTLSGDEDEEQYVWSLREVQNAAGTGFIPSVNWYEELPDGEHVLGPMRLVGETLYYSTWGPPADMAAACEGGVSRIWGVHYLTPANAASIGLGGLGKLSLMEGTPPAPVTYRSTTLPTGTLVFGVSVEFVPTCFDTSQPSDAYLGGTRTQLKTPSPPQMQLVFQTGTTDTTKQDLNFKTGFETLALAPPPNASTVESWAAILE